MTGRYSDGVHRLMRHAALSFALFAAMLVATAALFRIVPGSLAPTEDQGYILAIPLLQDAASLDRTEKAADQLSEVLLSHPAVDEVISFAGIDVLTFAFRTNAGVIWVVLKDWHERHGEELSPRSVVAQSFGAGIKIRDAMILAFEPPPIEGLGATGGFDAYIQSRTGSDYKALEAAAQQLAAAAARRKELVGVTSTFSASVPQMSVDLNREQAKLLGVRVTDVFDALQSTFGALYVNDFNRDGRVFRVHLQSDAQFRSRPDDIRDVYVRGGSGELIPLTALVTVREVTGPEVIERFNVFPSAKVLGSAAPGFSSGEAIAAMEQVAAETLPEGYELAWTGAAYQESVTGGTSTTVFLVGVLMVFLVLAAQYERWTLPFAVILAVPFAVFGALLAVFLRGLENDIYFQIGLVTLVGLASKNAILIVQFASLKASEGMPLAEAAIQGARMRLRPIIMTSLAFILGVTPLALSSGAGAASRHSIGTGVIGGMLLATFVATFFIPLFYSRIAAWRLPRRAADASRPAQEPGHA